MKKGVDCCSDHQLVEVNFRFKLKGQKRLRAQLNKYDTDQLRKDGEGREDFRWECRNRFWGLEVIKR